MDTRASRATKTLYRAELPPSRENEVRYHILFFEAKWQGYLAKYTERRSAYSLPEHFSPC